MKDFFRLLKDTISQWLKNEPFQQSAIIAYYTLFSLPSLLVIVIGIAGYFFGKSAVQGQIIEQLEEVLGTETAESIEGLITNVSLQEETTVAIIISIGILVFASTGAFFQLKKSMNKIWRVREKRANVIMMIINRGISLGLVVIIGLMMTVALVATTLATALGDYISAYLPDLSLPMVNIFNFLFLYVFIGFLFTLVYKFLPDIKIQWRTTIIGALITTLLFLIAVFALGIYFGKSQPTSVYGGASSVILIMLWVYYSCLVLFLGAEFTVQYALFKNVDIKPNQFSEPAYIQEIKELKNRKLFLSDKQVLHELIDKEEEKNNSV